MNLLLLLVFIYYLYSHMLYVTYDIKLISLFILSMNEVFSIISIFDLS